MVVRSGSTRPRRRLPDPVVAVVASVVVPTTGATRLRLFRRSNDSLIL
jgi:hypothetical protein